MSRSFLQLLEKSFPAHPKVLTPRLSTADRKDIQCHYLVVLPRPDICLTSLIDTSGQESNGLPTIDGHGLVKSLVS